MKAVLVERFATAPRVLEVEPPTVTADGVIIRVEATGLCRSDWHGWQGHDRDIVLPHVPGHEFAGTVIEAGPDVVRFAVGDRVTAPFVCACGSCAECSSGNQQTCLRQQQPGFTYWGSFAEFVAVPWADVNLVRLPDSVSFVAAAGLGCRFATAYRGVRQVGQVQAGEWVAVFGCGGVGLAAITLAASAGARVIAVDVNPAALSLASTHGAAHLVQAGSGRGTGSPDVATQVRMISDGGAVVAIEAIGAADAVQSALDSLRPRGRLVQIGLLAGKVAVDMGALISRELRWLGSHGMAARSYPELLVEIARGDFDPASFVVAEISLGEVPNALLAIADNLSSGVTVIVPSR
ncbi:alcohol dehydrogenase catalytic domain-containing protein [Jatrophihabitans sp. DSM 45814]